MKITGLQIDGYGVWKGLTIESLSDELNVLYGPNEAGKTTLLQFLRSVLYGFSPGRRHYLPPIRGGRPGGSLDVAGPNGSFHLQRYYEENENGHCEDSLTLSAADGTRQGEHMLKVLLGNVDEPIFNNVFAVGLQEIQELGTLGDTEAADMLFSLTAGLDRVSLVEVMRELETSRNRLLDRQGGPCQIAQLLEQRTQLRSEIDEAGETTRRYERLVAKRNRLQREIAHLEEEDHRLEQEAHATELAVTLRPRWQQRTELDEQLAALGKVTPVPEDAVARLDEINARLQKHQNRVERLRDQYEELRSESVGLGINETLWRQAARIEGLGQQQSWLGSLGTQVDELETEISLLQSELNTEREQLGLRGSLQPATLPEISSRATTSLRPAAKASRQAQQRLREAKQQVAAAEESARVLSAQIENALAAHGEGDLAKALDAAAQRVSQLRRRVGAGERLDELTRHGKELEEQNRRLSNRQILPIWVLASFGIVFVAGIVAAMAGLFMPASITGSFGWPLALLGLAGSVGAALGKFLLERSYARQLETCHKQIGMLQLQVRQATDERDSLDRQLPQGGGPIPVRLDTAEKHLAALEALTPLETQRDAARQEIHAATGRVNLIKDKVAAARRQWREALTGAGLPNHLTPKQISQLQQRCDHLNQLQRTLTLREEEMQQRRRELDALVQRIGQLVAETGVAVDSQQPIEQLRQLVDALADQEVLIERRAVLRREARSVRRQRAKHGEAIRQWKYRREDLLRECGTEDEQQFRHQAVQAARAAVLHEQREAVGREMAAAIGNQCSEETVSGLLRTETDEQLDAHCNQLLEQLTTLENDLHERIEQRGRLAEQLKTLADDRTLAEKQLELGTVDKRLDDALNRWGVLALIAKNLEAIRTTYERERQPETLQEASGYLDRLTKGRYCRVWTPLGEDSLKVDDADGNSLPVELLSRGTREQLFLALRLALAAGYSRRGAALPLVLDDVLVNFDTHRAKAAAAVLRDFAAEGHQLLIFTCHEHIFKLFKSLKVPVSRLPDNADAEGEPLVLQPPSKPRRAASRKSTPTPIIVAEEPKEESPADQIALADEEEELWEEDELEDVPEDEEEEYEDDEYEEYEEEDELEDNDTAEAA